MSESGGESFYAYDSDDAESVGRSSSAVGAGGGGTGGSLPSGAAGANVAAGALLTIAGNVSAHGSARPVGRRMFVEDAPIVHYDGLPLELVNKMRAFVDNNLFPQCKFYVEEKNLDEVIGYVMYLCGYGGESESDRVDRMRMWVACRMLVGKRTNDLRQLVYDRWYKHAAGKCISLKQN
jgi:hypothetical protein